MRDNRFFIKVGVLLLLLLTGILFFIPVALLGDQAPSAAAVVETITFAPSLMGVLVVVALITLGLAFLALQIVNRNSARKRKHEGIDPYLTDMIDDGDFYLEADGELPDWMNDPGEKPKREGDL